MLTAVQVYVTILASLPTLPAGLRASVKRNLTEIVELHEGILGELYVAVPHSGCTQPDIATSHASDLRNAPGHKRWISLDSVPEDKGGKPSSRSGPEMTTEPQVAAEVANIFSRRVSQVVYQRRFGNPS